jgi:hypothetical protein
MQLEVVASTFARVQFGELNVPLAELAVPRLKPTIPEGLTGAPAVDVSLTEILQLDGVFTVTGLEQATMIEVVRRLMTMLLGVTVELLV